MVGCHHGRAQGAHLLSGLHLIVHRLRFSYALISFLIAAVAFNIPYPVIVAPLSSATRAASSKLSRSDLCRGVADNQPRIRKQARPSLVVAYLERVWLLADADDGLWSLRHRLVCNHNFLPIFFTDSRGLSLLPRLKSEVGADWQMLSKADCARLANLSLRRWRASALKSSTSASLESYGYHLDRMASHYRRQFRLYLRDGTSS